MSDPINADPSPKMKFHENKSFVEAHNNMIQSQVFDLSADIALMEYQRNLVVLTPTENNLNQAAVAHIKILGAMEYLKCLKYLGIWPVPTTTNKAAGQLQHKK